MGLPARPAYAVAGASPGAVHPGAPSAHSVAGAPLTTLLPAGCRFCPRGRELIVAGSAQAIADTRGLLIAGLRVTTKNSLFANAAYRRSSASARGPLAVGEIVVSDSTRPPRLRLLAPARQHRAGRCRPRVDLLLRPKLVTSGRGRSRRPERGASCTASAPSCGRSRPGFAQFRDRRPYSGLDGDPPTPPVSPSRARPSAATPALSTCASTPSRGRRPRRPAAYGDGRGTPAPLEVNGRTFPRAPGLEPPKSGLPNHVDHARLLDPPVRRRTRAGGPSGSRYLLIPGVRVSEALYAALAPPSSRLRGHTSPPPSQLLFDRTTGDNPPRPRTQSSSTSSAARADQQGLASAPVAR